MLAPEANPSQQGLKVLREPATSATSRTTVGTATSALPQVRTMKPHNMQCQALRTALSACSPWASVCMAIGLLKPASRGVRACARLLGTCYSAKTDR